jgi:dihydrolipoamide dehydrogenase
MRHDIAIIGGGPGGLAAAEEAARRGLSVVLFEKDLIGGTCLNRGCIPTKALIRSAHAFDTLSHGADLGIAAENVSYDFPAMHARKDDIVSQLRKGSEKSLKTARVTVVRGMAHVAYPGLVTCDGVSYEEGDIIIATGSLPRLVPIEGIDLEGVYTSDDLLEGTGRHLGRLAIIGGGVIGIEMADLYASLGAEVTVLEMADRILPPFDREISQRVTMAMRKRGVSVETKASVGRIEGKPDAMTVAFTNKKGESCQVEADGVLVSTGRKANVEGLFSDDAMPRLDHGAVVAGDDGQTSIPHVYVIGDARAGAIQLAHAASAQGRNVVAAIAGDEAPVDERLVPSCVYTSPEVASVGITETDAKRDGVEVKSAKALTGANGKALIEDATAGYVKLVARKDDGVIVGAQLICPHATDLVSELTLAMHEGVTADDLASVIHPHPTISEMVGDAARALCMR